MKRQFFSRDSRSSAFRLPPSAFTLVEMLVVITIIGILASLITAAAISARRTAKNAAIVMEVKQLEMACQAYKEKFGEYPPDFAANDPSEVYPEAADGTTAYWQRAVLRHLARAFPRYRPGITTSPTPFAKKNWLGLLDDISGWGLNVTSLTPVGAMAFWLGGQPVWNGPAGNPTDPTKPVTAFRGFSANPANPFDNSPSRIQPFYEFNLMCLMYRATDGLAVWPTSACDQGSSPMVYFRANNGTYLQEGSNTAVKSYGTTVVMYPAVDTRLSNLAALASLTWVNPKSFQIFCSGQDMTYGTLGTTPTLTPNNVLAFPAGTNYGAATFDDITNFSGGKLEDAIPE